jgi:hypothetical protein
MLICTRTPRFRLQVIFSKHTRKVTNFSMGIMPEKLHTYTPTTIYVLNPCGNQMIKWLLKLVSLHVQLVSRGKKSKSGLKK